MTQEELLTQLEELAARLDIQIRQESVKSEDPATFGGYCRIGQRHVIIVHSRASTRRKIDILSESLKRFSVDELFLLPALRDHLKQPDA
jgi:hypothetical protein